MDVTHLVTAIVDDADDADARLDALYPPGHRAFRAQHASPVEVCLAAARWLSPTDASRVLDVGAGAGRFCIVGALATRGHFTGLERRARLVDDARRVAEALGATRARFVHGELEDVDLAGWTGFYLFNPFVEHVLPADERIDEEVPHDPARRDADIARMEDALARAPVGTRLALWNGFGGHLEGWSCAHRRYVRHCPLELLERR